MAQTRQTIQNFYTQSQSKDFARTNLFRVLNVDFGDGSDQAFDEDDLVYATTVSLPGKEITTNTVPYMGLNFNVPGVAKYPGSSDYNLRFRCDENYNLRDRFLSVFRNLFQQLMQKLPQQLSKMLPQVEVYMSASVTEDV